MGLDAVELVMDVEDRFGITIRDTEANGIRTVGDLVALIRTRIISAKSLACPTLPAFLTLRRAVREIVNDNTFRMRPRDRVDSLLPPHLCRELWRRLAHMLGTQPSSLRRPPTLRKVLAASSIGLLLSAIAVAAIDWQILPLTLFVAAVLIFLLYFATSPCCTVPPSGWVTMGDLTRRIVGTTAATTDLQLDDDEAVLRELQPIVASSLGVDATEVVPAARFVEDLGMG